MLDMETLRRTLDLAIDRFADRIASMLRDSLRTRAPVPFACTRAACLREPAANTNGSEVTDLLGQLALQAARSDREALAIVLVASAALIVCHGCGGPVERSAPGIGRSKSLRRDGRQPQGTD